MIATMLIMLNLCTNVRMASELNTKRRSFIGQKPFTVLDKTRLYQHGEKKLCILLQRAALDGVPERGKARVNY